jgi:hypothetical protein
MLYDPSVCDTVNVDAFDVDDGTSGAYPHPLAFVCSMTADAGYDLIAFTDDIIDPESEVGKGVA